MKKNLGPDQEDRGVESHDEVVEIDGKKIVRRSKPVLDGLGQPAAAEDDLGGD